MQTMIMFGLTSPILSPADEAWSQIHSAFFHPLAQVVLLGRVPEDHVHAAGVRVVVLQIKLRLQNQILFLEVICPVFETAFRYIPLIGVCIIQTTHE